MKTTFETLNEQEMTNVNGGRTVITIIDKNGRKLYIVIEDGIDFGSR